MYIVVKQNILSFFSNWAKHPQVVLRIRLDKITQGFFSTQSQSVSAGISDILAVVNFIMATAQSKIIGAE